MRIKDIIIIFLFIFACATGLVSDALNQFGLYICLPIAFILSLSKENYRFPNKYYKLLFLLLIWDCMSYCWAVDKNLASREVHKVLGVLLISFVVASSSKSGKIVKWMYIGYILMYLGMWYYAETQIGTILSDVISEETRMSDDRLNANTLSYYTFYTSFSLFILGEIINNRFVKFVRILFILMIPVSLYSTLLTASRQMLVIQIPLFIILIYKRYFQIKGFNRIFILIIISIAALIFANQISELYNNSYLKTRTERRTLIEETRIGLISDAIKVGLEHQPFGVGAGNYIMYSYNNHFSHCSYTELFTNNGIIGLTLYLILIYIFLSEQINRYRETKDVIFYYFAIWGLLFTVYNIFYVFYNDPWLISFLILVASHSEQKYRSYQSQNITDIQI